VSKFQLLNALHSIGVLLALRDCWLYNQNHNTQKLSRVMHSKLKEEASMKARIENQIWDTIRKRRKDLHLDNPSGAKSLSSADGTSRAWSAIGRSAGNVAADWWIQTDQLINDA